MNVLYVLRSIAHLSYHESIIRALAAQDCSIHLLFDREWSGNRSLDTVQAQMAEIGDITVEWALRRRDLWRRPLFAFREIRSYVSYLTRSGQSEYYTERWRGHMPTPARWMSQSAFGRKLLSLPAVCRLLQATEQLSPPDQQILQQLRAMRPAVLVASPVNMRYSEEVEYVRAAQSLAIPTAVPVLSWDNLTTKGLFHVTPDLTLVWNRQQWLEATQIHRLPPDRIVITGSPFFDKWLEAPRLEMDREAFCRRVGLDSDQPFLLYLGSSANIARDETWLVSDLARCLRQHPNPDLRAMNILARPHPANARVYGQLHDAKVRVWPKEGALPDSEESLQDFYNSLRHSVATVGINTTGMIDAVIMDRPCLALITDHYQATQMQATHFQYLLNADVLEAPNSPEACADLVNEVLRGVDSKREARRQFVREFARPHGVKWAAGQIAAHAIEMLALGREVPRTFDNLAALAQTIVV